MLIPSIGKWENKSWGGGCHISRSQLFRTTAYVVVAARLAVADPEISVLLIKGGPNKRNDPTIEYPVLFLVIRNLFYMTKLPLVGDREAVLPAGGVLGGSSFHQLPCS
jgi:choline dehydrogenase-like flavoprotein